MLLDTGNRVMPSAEVGMGGDPEKLKLKASSLPSRSSSPKRRQRRLLGSEKEGNVYWRVIAGETEAQGGQKTSPRSGCDWMSPDPGSPSPRLIPLEHLVLPLLLSVTQLLQGVGGGGLEKKHLLGGFVSRHRDSGDNSPPPGPMGIWLSPE